LKKCILSFLMAAVLLLAGCAGSSSEAADEPVVKPQNTASQDDEQTSESTDSEAQQTDAAADEGQNSTSETVSQLVSDLREHEAVNRENKEVIDIEEKIYLSQMTDIYMNTEDYIGRILSMEGYMLPDDTGDDIIGAVVRNTPGCCGDDGITGLSYIWDGEVPADNDWIKVTGVLSIRTEGEQVYLILEAQSVEIKTERGEDFVSQ